MASLKEIARDAGVSVSTVSSVLNEKAAERGIAHGTQARVAEAAARLKFRPNPHARALRTGRSNLIGVLGVNLDAPIPLRRLRYAARALRDQGYGVALLDFDPRREDAEALQHALVDRHVEGLLITDRSLTVGEMGSVLEQCELPVIVLDECDLPGVDVVTVDREEGAYLATRHLLALGHRRIVLTVDPDTRHRTRRARIAGYSRACAEAGVAVDRALFIGTEQSRVSFKDGAALMTRVLACPAQPTALFCMNDRLAMGAMRALCDLGVRVPEDLALAGYDGMEEAAYAVVPLTTVVQPVAEVAQAAVSLLLERLNGGGDRPAPQRIALAPRLLVRRSCGAALSR